MKSRHGFLIAGAVLILAGCNGREAELESEMVLMQSRMDSLHSVIASKDSYFDEIVTSINRVYANLEEVRVSEEQIKMQAGEEEGGYSVTSSESRVNLLNQVDKIGSSLEESRKQIARLESRIGLLNREQKGLNEMVAALKQQLAEREQTIAVLETNLRSLEGEIVEKSRLIVQRDSVIQSKETELNTVYYIAGTRSELEELGIIDEEGGFLWGLLGSTPVLSSGMDETLFNRFDISADRFIAIDGEIEELVPKRNEEYYMSTSAEEHSTLQILDTDKFWQERFLVIITG